MDKIQVDLFHLKNIVKRNTAKKYNYANSQVKSYQNRKCKTCGTTQMNPTLPTYFSGSLQGKQPADFLFSIRWEKQNFLLSLVDDATIWGQGNKDTLTSSSRNKQYDLVFFLMYRCFLNYNAIPQNTRYHSSIHATLQF